MRRLNQRKTKAKGTKMNVRIIGSGNVGAILGQR